MTPGRCRPPVAGDRLVLVGLQIPDVEGADGRGQSVDGPLLFGLERAEHPVPDNEDARVVAVEILGIGPVVNSMVRWRVEDELDRCGKLPYSLGVDEELIDETEREPHEHHPRRDADEGSGSHMTISPLLFHFWRNAVA